jgi:hypothetical protein
MIRSKGDCRLKGYLPWWNISFRKVGKVVAKCVYVDRKVTYYFDVLGNAEWDDSSQRALVVIFKSPAVIAEDIYRWASDNALIGSVSTVYELHAGEDTSTGKLLKCLGNRCNLG